MKAAQRRVVTNLFLAGIDSKETQMRVARTLRAEWETFLAETAFAFSEDALSKEMVSLEEAGLEDDFVVDTVPAAQAEYYADEA